MTKLLLRVEYSYPGREEAIKEFEKIAGRKLINLRNAPPEVSIELIYRAVRRVVDRAVYAEPEARKAILLANTLADFVQAQMVKGTAIPLIVEVHFNAVPGKI